MNEKELLKEYIRRIKGEYHDDSIYSLSYGEKVDYLCEWMMMNKELSKSDFVDQLYQQILLLDMVKYKGPTLKNPRLILYSGKSNPYSNFESSSKLYERLEKYESLKQSYILANQSEIIDFVTEVINFSLGNEIPFDYEYSQPRLNNLCFSKAVEYLASGNVPAIIMNNTTPMSLPEVPIRQMFSFQNQHKPLA